MSLAFASYKVTHKATTGGNSTVNEGHLTLHPAEDNNHTEEIFRAVVGIIAANYEVSEDAVMIVNFNILPDTID